MRTSIIAVGTELLFGQVINTNAAFLSEQLNNMGFDVMYHFVVGDNPGRLRATIDLALKDTDIILLTGGLGPTQDDLTKETVANAFGVGLYRDEGCLAEVRSFFDERGRVMTENNLKQADMPEGATIFHNASGTAPAFAIEKAGKHAVCFPGPPREMKWIWEHGAKQYLQALMGKRTVYKVIRTIGIGESDLETVLLPFIDGQTDPTVATYAKEGECTLRVASQRDTQEEAEKAVAEMVSEIDRVIGDYIYSCDNENLNEVVVRKLMDKGMTLTCAESCTGGMFASSVTDVPGASAVFKSGFVTYSAEAKTAELGVAAETIEKHSVVSPETAVEMAAAAQRKSGADIAVSITGYAGPLADPGRECGEAYIGYAYGERTGCIRLETKRSDRKWNRYYFVLRMFRAVNDLLEGRDAE